MSSLPALPLRSPPNPKTPQLPVSFGPVATKADRYEKLVEIDQKTLQRPKAHFRNALKTTEGLEMVTKRLERRLATDGLHDKSGGISFERLSAFKDAFNEVVKLSEAYAPQLNQIKSVYNEHVLFMLSQQQNTRRLFKPGSPIAPYHHHTKTNDELGTLKKRVHQLEVESRVLLHENERLTKERSQEAAVYKEDLTRIHEEGDAAIAQVLAQPVPPKDYAAKVEELQEKIMEGQDAISREYDSRKGSVPLTVCHNLEQCLREVEIEMQKRQRRNTQLREEIKKYEAYLDSALHERNLQFNNDLAVVLGLS